MTPDPLFARALAWLNARRPELLLLFFGVLLPLLLFGLVAEDVLEHEAFRVDRWLLLLLHAHSGPGLDRAMLTLSFIGSVWLMAPLDLLIAALLAWQRRWRSAIFWTLAVGGAALLNGAAKHLIARVRPDLWISIAPEASFSFPSGHAMQSAAFAGALRVLAWPTRCRTAALLGGALFVVSIGASRVYLGVHFPTDILGGWTASLAWVVGLQLVLWRRPRQPIGGNHGQRP